MALHRLTALALVGALALGASGCGDDSPSPAPRTSSAAASPTPSPTGPAAPVLPELATRKDELGAKAFVKYWFAAFTYAMRTGDSSLLMATSADECMTCKRLRDGVRGIYETGGRVRGGNWVPVAFADDPSAPAPLLRWLVQVKQSRHRIEGAAAGNGPVAQKYVAMRISVVWRDGMWQLQEAAKGQP